MNAIYAEGRLAFRRVKAEPANAKQVNAIYAEGRLAFRQVKAEPANAKPEDCRLLEHEQTILWENVL